MSVSLAEQVAEVRAGPELSDIESELVLQIDRARAAPSGKVIGASGVDAVCATLMGVFDHFLLQEGALRARKLDLIGS